MGSQPETLIADLIIKRFRFLSDEIARSVR